MKMLDLFTYILHSPLYLLMLIRQKVISLKQISKSIFTLLFISLSFSPLYSGEGDVEEVLTPKITVSPDLSVDEGNSGTKTVNMTISIDECPDKYPIKIKYKTGYYSAKASDNDYVHFEYKYITFNVGSCTKTHTIGLEIIGDTKYEKDEQFRLYVRNAGTHRKQPFTGGHQDRLITIKNDDENKQADLHIKKGASKTNGVRNKEVSYVDRNDIVWYTLTAKNLGPYHSRIKVIDTLPAGLEYISVSDNSNNFNCNYNSGNRKIKCTGSRVFNKNEKVDIKVKVKVIVDGPKIITNTAVVSSPNNRADPKTGNNTSSKDLYLDTPGDGKNTVDIKKTVNDITPEVGDIVTFTIKVTNKGFDKRIALRDKFPTQADEWGTTGGAFELVEIVNPTPGVTCEIKGKGGTKPYVFCYTDAPYTHNQSFTVALRAKIIKRGNLCNRAYSYEYYWIDQKYSTVCVEATGNIPPTLAGIPDETILIGDTYPHQISAYANDPDGDTLTYSATGLPPGLSIDSTTGSITGNATAVGTYTTLATVSDGNGGSASDEFIINVVNPPIIATPNIYKTKPGITISGNFITDDTGNGSDSGLNIGFVRHTPPAKGTLNIGFDGSFTYVPDSTTVNTITFTYTIKDDFGDEATATVTINIGTDYSQGYKEFERINPPRTRNIIGDYLILGNTVTCVTSSETDYNGACTNDATANNNLRMVKYIDIDSDPKTWNSSSSNFELDNAYDQQGGEGILWAGLFWQGGIHNDHTDFRQRRAFTQGATYAYQDINSDSNLDLETTNGNKILMKIDGDTDYTPLQATTLYYDTAHENKGGYYAAYTDVTQLLKSKNLAKGEHTVTVANLTTNEGRDERYGNYGGWSLVIIYKQDDFNGLPRNISIFNGYVALSAATGGTPKQEIKIAGFRLPQLGPIKAKFSTFTGEGEKLYGSGANNYDKMTIKRTPTDTAAREMPGADDATNIFDAKLANIDRDSTGNNMVLNTNGIDIDSYNVSDIMTDYRDLDQNISSVYIALSTNDDYVTPSMMGFSTELYQPNICYDYTLDIDGYPIESNDNVVKTPFGSYSDKPITTRISVKSKEGDFALTDVNISYRIHDTTQLQYKPNTTAIAPNGTYAYLPAGPSGLNRTYQQTTRGFGMYIGEGAQSLPDGPGGVIDAYETRYLKFDNKMLSSSIDTKFDLWIEYNIDYGSGALSLSKSFGKASLCQEESGYYPAWGNFNISSSQSDTTTGRPYNLYTQVSSREFDARITSYADDFKTPKTVDTSIEVEVFNAGHFSRDTNISCNNPDANISMPMFIRFDNKSSIPLERLRYDLAIRNAGFRIWHLTAEDGSVVEHTCTSKDDESCFKTLYADKYTTDTSCNTECTTGGTGCYPCLRTYYGKPTCSRDNFSIRPEAFVTTLKDSNQSSDTTDPSLALANSHESSIPGLQNTANLIAGYDYRFDINATNYINDNSVPGYLQVFNTESFISRSQMKWSPKGGRDVSNCNDPEDKNISVVLFAGSSLNSYLNTVPTDQINQVGEYDFILEDENWTAADWDEILTKHHDLDGFDAVNKDCIPDENRVQSSGSQGKQGCIISSQHIHPNGDRYTALELKYYPYSFDVSGLNSGAGPDNSRNFVYINQLQSSLYPGGIDENMSYNIQGTFKAGDYSSTPVSNFVKGCYAEDVNMKLWHTYLTDIPASTPDLSYDLIDYNTTDASIITKARTQGNFLSRLSKNIKEALDVTQEKEVFTKDMEGAVSMDLGFNFARTNNNPLNPRRILFSDFNVSLVASPDINVDMKTDHKIFGNKRVDQNVTFLYARARAEKTFYDDITDAEITTPISIVAYCDLGFAECQNRGIMAAFAQTNEYDWWKSWDHNSNVDGKIEIKSTPSDALNINSVAITSQGESNAISVKRGTLPLPAIVPVNFVTDEVYPLNYTNRWLIYNPDSATTVPSPFYRVRFIGNSGWAGHGETGHVVGGDSNVKKNKRLEW